MVIGGQELADDEMEAATTLGPRQEDVSRHEGVKLETGMGVEHEGVKLEIVMGAGCEIGSPCAIYKAGVGRERVGGRMERWSAAGEILTPSKRTFLGGVATR
jgi:hypothetical protein